MRHLLEYAYSLEFEEEPDYDKLRFLIVRMALDRNQTPIYKFDWSYDHPDYMNSGQQSVLERRIDDRSVAKKNRRSSRFHQHVINSDVVSGKAPQSDCVAYHHLGPFAARFGQVRAGACNKEQAIFYSNYSQRSKMVSSSIQSVPDEVSEGVGSGRKVVHLLPSIRNKGYEMSPHRNYPKMA